MDHYLDIAVAVLRTAKRPLRPRAILTTAYRSGLVPAHLHGKTQHKTLQARISEDIVARREHSPFFRTAPGHFFLRDFLTDLSLPDKYRRELKSRRRVRELLGGPALAFDRGHLERLVHRGGYIDVGDILELLHSNSYRYDDPRRSDQGSVFLWSFVSVYRDDAVLSYRMGRYRDDRDTFVSKRSIGFSTLVHQEDRTLFSLRDFGIVDSGVQATRLDLDILETNTREWQHQFRVDLRHFRWISYGDNSSDLLAVIDFECPSWFEPLKRRLAMNDLCWLNLSVIPNDIEDFDPWSKSIITERCRVL